MSRTSNTAMASQQKATSDKAATGVVYIRWGKKTCPDDNELVYSGMFKSNLFGTFACIQSCFPSTGHTYGVTSERGVTSTQANRNEIVQVGIIDIMKLLASIYQLNTRGKGEFVSHCL